jgi:large subunit ribosomal protein L25
MSQPAIEVETRTCKGSNKLNALRRVGKVPAVLYGHNDRFPPQNIQCDERSFRQMLSEGRKLFKVKGLEGDEIDAIVVEVQVDELTDKLLHIDFRRVESQDDIEIKIPLSVKGTPKGARMGGRLEVFLYHIKIKTSLQNLIEEFVLDVSDLDIGQRITLADLKLKEGVKALGQATTTVCILHPPKGSRGVDQESEDKKEDKEGEKK